MMGHDYKLKPRSTKLGHFTLALVVFWTFVIAGFTFWHVHHLRETTHELAIKEAKTIFNKDQAFRFWATNHGGVYVPTNKRTPSNPNLAHIPERDIVTPSGKKLTLMNPAYIIRQVQGEFAALYQVSGHITSLKPLRQKNAPDAWESKILATFERGVKEVSELSDINGEPYLRLMLPMRAKKGCLKCHGHQGYKVGDIRGGVSVSVPMTPYLAQEYRGIIQIVLPHIIIWLIGLFFIGMGYRGMRSRINERERAEEALKETNKLLKNILDSSSSVSIISTDLEQNVLFWNKGAENLFRYKSEEIVGHQKIDILYPDDETKRVLEIRSLIVKNKRGVNSEIIEVTKDGQKLCINLNLTPRFDEKGNFVGILGIGEDITERKRAEEELAKHREALEELVEERTDELTKANQQLNQQIEERKKAGDELKKRTDELQTMVNAMAGRELRMAELKKVIEKLRAQIESEGLTPVADDPLKEVGKDYT